jgi:flagellar basal-body rod protein FlgC
MSDPLMASIKVAGTGLQAQSHRVRIVSENIANKDATGKLPGANPYTRKTIVFASEFDRELSATAVRVDHIGVDRSPYSVEHDPGHPAADQNGYVKRSNVNMLVELADIREANRSYEANLQIVKQARAMIGMTIDLMRSNG